MEDASKFRILTDSPAKISRWLGTSIGKKQIVAITAIIISGFILMHVSANMLLFVGPKTYNYYSYQMVNNPLLIPIELFLLAAFLLHLGMAFSITRSNRLARGTKPSQGTNGQKSTTWAARTMILSGIVIFVFLVLHLITFKYGPHYSATYDGVEMRDLYRLVQEKFQDPVYVCWYIIALLLLGLHLSHGFRSLFQTLGFASYKNGTIQKLAWGLTAFVTLGFIAQPLYFFLGGN